MGITAVSTTQSQFFRQPSAASREKMSAAMKEFSGASETELQDARDDLLPGLLHVFERIEKVHGPNNSGPLSDAVVIGKELSSVTIDPEYISGAPAPANSEVSPTNVPTGDVKSTPTLGSSS